MTTNAQSRRVALPGSGFADGADSDCAKPGAGRGASGFAAAVSAVRRCVSSVLPGRGVPAAAGSDSSVRARKPLADAKKGFSSRQGLWGERKAEEFLVGQKRMKLLGRRVKISRDELDLVMATTDRKVRMIVFVEVKTRTSRLFGGGRGAMDRRKRHALCRAAARYMRRMPEMPFRIDLVEVYGSCDSNAEPEIIHHERAVPMELRYNYAGLHGRRGNPAH